VYIAISFSSQCQVKVKCHPNLITSEELKAQIPTELHQFLISCLSVVAWKHTHRHTDRCW